MLFRLRILLLLLSMTITPPIVAARVGQQETRGKSEPASSPTPMPRDIIVEGIPSIGKKPPIIVNPPASQSFGIRRLSEQSEQFARCAKHLDLKLLSDVIDGTPGSASEDVALGRLIQSDLACFPNVPSPPPNSFAGCRPKPIDTFLLDCQSFYDRGAILAKAIRTYAPDLDLTVAQTNDPVVQARFNKLEGPRNRSRLPPNFHYFEIAVCMVRLQPKLAVRLVRSDIDARSQGSIEQAIIVRAKQCVGDAKEVVVDPTQFRVYITDAVYRWVLAARGVNSLLPLNG